MGKSQINATDVTMPLLGKTILEDTWKHTTEKYDLASSYARSLKAHFKTHSEIIEKNATNVIFRAGFLKRHLKENDPAYAKVLMEVYF